MEKRILWEEQNHTNTATTPFLEKEDYTIGKTTRIHSEKSRRLKRTAALETKDPNSYIPIRHFAVLKIERNSHEIIYESVNADFVAIALFLFLSRHQIKKTDNDIEIEEFIKKEIAHGNIDLARQVIAENFGEKTISFEKNVFDKISVITLSTNKIDIFYHGNTILFCSEFNKPDLERGYLIAFNKCRMINIYHKIMVNITNIIPDVNENENRKLKYLFLVGDMEK